MPSQTRDRHQHHQQIGGSLKPSLSLLSLCSQKTDEKENKIPPRQYHSLRKKSKPKRSSIIDGCWNGTTTVTATPPSTTALSSASLFNSSLNGSLLTEDFMWTSFQPNYINMMNDTNLMEECNEANLELSESTISSTINTEKLYAQLQSQNGGDKRKWSPDQTNDAPRLLQWITYMENYLTAVAPTFSEIRKMNSFELQARLKEHIRIRQYIAVHSKSVTKLVKIAQDTLVCQESVINMTELENRYLNLLLKAIEIQCALEELPPDSGRDSQWSSSDNEDGSQINVKRCNKKIFITSSSESIHENGDISDFEEISENSAKHEIRSKFKINQLLDTNGMQSSITSFTCSSLSMLPTTNCDYPPHSNENNLFKSTDVPCSSSEISSASFQHQIQNDNCDTKNRCNAENSLEYNESIKKWLNTNSNSCSDINDSSNDNDNDSVDLSWDDFQMMYPKSDSPYSSDVAVQTTFSHFDTDHVSNNNESTSDQSTIIENDLLIDADENFDTLKPSDFADIAEVCQNNVECLQKLLYGEIGKRCQQSKYFKLNIRQFNGNDTLAAAEKSHEWCIVEKKCRCSKISRFLTRVVDFLLDLTNFIKKFALYKCLVNLIRKLYEIIHYVGSYVKFGRSIKNDISQPHLIESAEIVENIEPVTKMYISTESDENTTKIVNNKIIDVKPCKSVDISEVCQTNVDYLQKLLETDLEKKLDHLNGFKLIIKNVDAVNSSHEICVIKTKCKCPLVFRLLTQISDLISKIFKCLKKFIFYTFFMYPKRKICQLLHFLSVRIRMGRRKLFVKCL